MIELLVVLAIASLIAGLAFPGVDRALGRQRFNATGDQIARALWTARADAIRQGRSIAVTQSADGRVFGVAGGAATRIDGDMRVDMSPRGIGFCADGTTTGGVIRLVAARYTTVLRIDPATGVITKS